jgi:acetyl esterase/lipase
MPIRRALREAMSLPVVATCLAVQLVMGMAGCSAPVPSGPNPLASPTAQAAGPSVAAGPAEPVTADTSIAEVVGHPAFAGFGRFLFPIGSRSPSPGMTLEDAGDLLPYHSHVEVDTSVDVVNSLIGSVLQGQTVFYDIYSEAEKAAEPGKADTGLFFLKGEPGAPFAVVSAGGGFVYVGSIHESLPHALELSRRGYNAFVLQYRTGGGAQVANEDLAAAISFVFRHAAELGVGTRGYSLWGGSAGARMAASLGSRGPAAFGGDDLPRPATVVMQYTGHSEYSPQDPPTYACVGQDDGIANWRTMKARVDALSALGVPTEFHAYPNLSHGFGLGVGTTAAGWIDDAVAFWDRQRRR